MTTEATSTARRRLVAYVLTFRDPDTGELLPEWTDEATGRTIVGGPFTRHVEAVEAARPFVNYHVERRALTEPVGLT